MKTPSRSVVYVLDDDPIFTRLISAVLKRFSIECETFNSSIDILSRLLEETPALCILDLNVEKKDSSLGLLRSIRTGSSSIPLIVVSSNSNKQAIAHAIEMGANDYLLKPLERNILVSKLMRYLSSPELVNAAHDFPTPPELDLKVSLELDADLVEVDELGVKVIFKAMAAKGSVIALSGSILRDITGRSKPILVTATSTWVENEGNLYGAYLEFDNSDKELLQNVRSWLASRQKAS